MFKLVYPHDKNNIAPSDNRQRKSWSAYDAVLPPLVVLAPFIVFLKHNGYPVLTPETLQIYGSFILLGGGFGLAAAAGGRLTRSLMSAFLIVLFVDIQFDLWWGKKMALTFAVSLVVAWFLGHNATRILTFVFATIAISSLMLPASFVAPDDPAQAGGFAAGRVPNSRLPILVYIVLDEHIGIEGIPYELDRGRQLRDTLTAFYLSNNFRVFGRAYSEYFNTYNALSHTMNFSPGTHNSELTTKTLSSFRYEMHRNELFSKLQDTGFRLHVSQPNFLSLCLDTRVSIAACDVTNFTSIDSLSRSPLSALQKSRVILSVFVERMFLYGELKKFNVVLNELLLKHGLNVPLLNWERDGKGTLAATDQIKQIHRQIATAEPGDAYFVHLLLPHNPYVYARNCELKEPNKWLLRGDKLALTGAKNTTKSRLRRYRAYLEQIECVTSHMGKIFDIMREAGTFDEALIIIHGDHGSRINIFEPSVDTIDRMVESDYLDAFSTLFVIKAPGIEPKYDRTVRSIQELVTSWADAGFNTLPNRVDEKGSAQVFLEGPRKIWVLHPLRGFAADKP